MMTLLYLPCLVVLALAVDLPTAAEDAGSCGPVSGVATGSLLQSTATHRPTRTPQQIGFTKTATSSQVRFVFFAGLEGSGHHFWHEMIKRLPINRSEDLSRALFDGQHGGFFNADEHSRGDYAEDIAKLMSEMEMNLSSTPGCKVVALNGVEPQVSGMMSYPNMGGKDRAGRNPDIFALAKLAEAAGVDLRIVLLTRHPESMVQSMCERNYEKDVAHAVREVAMTISLLSEQLELLDPSYVACWTYEDPGAKILELLSFMGICDADPSLSRQIVEEIYKPSNHPALSKAASEMLETSTHIHESLLAKWCS
ncbi:unnamed protein product [Symbiodinium natans]|uniref:Sulfotransferase domain-containing protein n=1 Tax=Symbiodinium natans TaxID=878477 RepID=A0A812KSC5_9DINO|nr:unnamed protein product [Symbiodinium natans]